MMLLLQAAPLLLLVALLLSGRAGPVPAVLAALLASLPAVVATLDAPTLPFLAEETLRGAFLALKPIAVVMGGLLFHAAVSGRGGAAAPADPAPRRIFVASLLMGGFMESVTGFAVGAVFALSAIRGMGLRGAPAGAMALLSLTLVPWGGLGPGTSLGAALTGLPAQQVAALTAWPNAAWLLLMGPVLWRLCSAAGVAVPAREKAVQMGVLLAMSGILLASHALFPFEVAGILATGIPLLAMLYRLDPPRGAEGWRRAFRSLAPYLLLTAALLLARSWTTAPAWTPYADLPGFPITHVAVVLWLVAGGLMLHRAEPLARGRTALARGLRPALAMLLYVVLARWMAGAGIAGALAQAAAEGLGPAAPYAVPVLGLASGIVTGSNVGSNAALMPVQAALGQAAGLPPLLAPALHNFSGAAGAGMSFAGTAMICGLLADGARPAQIWRLLAPSLAGVVLLGWAMVALLG
ncbi:L-lactate permease [Falsiroseomonas tokyonensis]|uniref:L-lactate permease n=1 Tax=Falsiroseomonas tokyonensis TaxID=430521 RepID=A0ABV7BPS0_9PROT|nr:L-lactate permease [Falsiroseomonas tokyonensis]MBU8537600.1 L-lactate permease [Falsiroseomonas tokyonensis]